MIKILLTDFNYPRRSPSPLATPTATGRIATYLKKKINTEIEITLLKDPKKYLDLINHNNFHIVGFSNYIWNTRLSLSLANHLKKIHKDCIIIFGGPELPIDNALQEEYVKKYHFVDFFIEKEGEIPFTNLIKSLDNHNLNIEKTKLEQIPSIRSMSESNEFLTSSLAERILKFDEIPSPFVDGLMDQFMEQGFTPLIVNNRGCPFTCEFCGEGDSFFNKIRFHSPEYLEEEFEYIAYKMSLVKNHPFPGTMYFADSNSGMYKQDLEVYARFGKIQKKYGYPKTIITATGKNMKARVIDAIRLLNGAISLTASVQSTSSKVLKNIKRDNISLESIVNSSQSTKEKGGNYSEIILGLPGDSYERHKKSIKDMIDSQIDHINCGQLMILNDTPMNSKKYRSYYGLKTKYRFLVKGFMQLPIAGEKKLIIEEEEICVGTKELPFSDYLKARVFSLFINVFYNNRYKLDHFSRFEDFNICVSDYIFEIVESTKPYNIKKIEDQFVEHLHLELYDSSEDLRAKLKVGNTYNLLVSGKIGVNLLELYTNKCLEYKNELSQIEEQVALSMKGDDFKNYIISKDNSKTILASRY